MPIEEVGVAEAKRRFAELAQRARHSDRKPVGFAALAGALAEWDTIDEDMAQVVETRKQAIDRAGSATAVTGNVRHFNGVPGLAVENWLKES